MTGTEILALVAFVALALALLLVLRGMSQVIAATRADEAFRRSMADIVGRASNVFRGVLEQADGMRYRGGPHPDLDRSVALANSQLAELLDELKSTQVPNDRRADHDAIGREVEAAAHASNILKGGSGEDAGVPGHDAGDADDSTARRVALKRGYLALAHAERSLAEHADALAHDPPRQDRRLFRR